MTIPKKFTLCLMFLFFGKMIYLSGVKLSSGIHQETGLLSVNVGATVTLQCFYEADVATMFSWYKQTLGKKPQLVSIFYRFDKNATFQGEFKEDSRFFVQIGKGVHHLRISDLYLSDSATYYCVSVYSNMFDFGEGTILNVKGSGSNFHAVIQQTVSESVQPGDSVTLNCTVHTETCDGEHSVYWFRGSGESHPGIIYTPHHGDRSLQCERSSRTQTQSCMYYLPMKNLTFFDAGIYYCAVVSCGEMLFGNGTKLGIKDGVSTLLYFMSAALVFTTFLIVILSCCVHKMKRKCQQHCIDSQTKSSALSPLNIGGHDADNLHYAALSLNKSNRLRGQRDNMDRDTVYSGVREKNRTVCVYSGIGQ